MSSYIMLLRAPMVILLRFLTQSSIIELANVMGSKMKKKSMWLMCHHKDGSNRYMKGVLKGNDESILWMGGFSICNWLNRRQRWKKKSLQHSIADKSVWLCWWFNDKVFLSRISRKWFPKVFKFNCMEIKDDKVLCPK